ncbi:hypothetical protein YC2023_053014 [Brassica napus]|uniref:Uncharacterized protein n=1 Tax=Brassica oleracea TaxID=3712 RepID=A0A3P6CBV8_BRAOL|nr:unnamed protein product [Brassica oleracea]
MLHHYVRVLQNNYLTRLHKARQLGSTRRASSAQRPDCLAQLLGPRRTKAH